MKCFCALVLLMTFTCLTEVNSAEIKIKDELQSMAQQIEILKTLHLTDVTRLRSELEDLKRLMGAPCAGAGHHHVQVEEPKPSVEEMRAELTELRESVANSSLDQPLQTVRNELKQALAESSELAQLAKEQETRIDHLDDEMARLNQNGHRLKNTLAEVQRHFERVTKEGKSKQLEELSSGSYNDVLEGHEEDAWERHAHKLRHNKVSTAQVFRVARAQSRLDERQRALQAQLQELQGRLDLFTEPNWNLLSAKVDMLELETQILRKQLNNNTQKVSDFDKVHASMLELREDVESIENKADKTVPELRKEISKLDINFAQLNAQWSYMKEDQENLRQSVKAIAVSVSNAIDRAELDRLALHRLNDSVCELDSRAKQHFSRLNDHILKSESNHDMNTTIDNTITLPELMGEVKELQPVESEYQDLVRQLPRDCSAILGSPGLYLINPGRSPIEVWCNNGSTLLQRRYNGTVEFNRNFNDYVRGFGDAASEFWLGLDAMHRLTADNCSSMRIDMTDIYGGGWYAQYERFSVGDADSGFVLEVSGFKGNASDAFEYQNHMEFSAIDRDRDISNTHCAGNYEGGWWFSHCQHVNINGRYTLGLTWFDSARNEWIAVATSEMRLYRRPGCH